MAGHGGGAWKVAYADFVTAMMAFFMVMWIVAQSKPVKQAVAGYFRDPMGYSKKSSGGSPVMPTNKPGDPPGPSLLPSAKAGNAGGGDGSHMGKNTPRGAAIKDEDAVNKKKDVEQKQPSLFVIHSGNRRYMGTIVLFPEGTAELDEAAKELLMPILVELRGKPQKLELRGHASRNPTGKNAGIDPWQLSYARCQAVMRFLLQNGIDPERIRLSQGGAYEPYSLQSDLAMQQKNSRVEIYVLDEYAENLKGTPEERAERYVHPDK
jgi:chemotaxis protein MotB